MGAERVNEQKDSAFGGKADTAFCTAYVRFWPKADMS